MKQNQSTWFYIGGAGLDRTDDLQKFVDQNLIGFNFIGSGLDSDWKISQSAHLWAVVYRIRILESNPPGFLDLVRFELDRKSFPFQLDPNPDYPNEIKRGHAKSLDMK